MTYDVSNKFLEKKWIFKFVLKTSKGKILKFIILSFYHSSSLVGAFIM